MRGILYFKPLLWCSSQRHLPISTHAVDIIVALISGLVKSHVAALAGAGERVLMMARCKGWCYRTFDFISRNRSFFFFLIYRFSLISSFIFPRFHVTKKFACRLGTLEGKKKKSLFWFFFVCRVNVMPSLNSGSN